MKKWRVVRDLQGGCFGMDRDYTLKEWREQAIEWSYADEDFEAVRQLKRYEIKNKDLLAFISGIWELEFEEVTEAVEPKEKFLSPTAIR